MAAAALGISSSKDTLRLIEQCMEVTKQHQEPNGLNKLVEYVRSEEKSLGDGSKKFLDVEKFLKLREI